MHRPGFSASEAEAKILFSQFVHVSRLQKQNKIGSHCPSVCPHLIPARQHCVFYQHTDDGGYCKVFHIWPLDGAGRVDFKV